MFCTRCGKQIDAAQPFCPHCGAATGMAAAVGSVPGAAPPDFSFSRVERHLRTAGILWVVFAGWLLLGWLLIWPFLHAFLGGRMMWMQSSWAGVSQVYQPGGWVLHIIAVAVLLRIVLSLLVGYALLTRQAWGRVFAIVISVFTLLKPVLGTILAIYTLWVLLASNAGPEYDRLALRGGAPPL